MKQLILFLLSITIGWDMITPEPGYRIHYTNGGIQYVGYSSTNRFTIEETLPRSYKVYVVATNTFGVSLPSRIVTVTNK